MNGGAVTGRLTTPDGWPIGGGTVTVADGGITPLGVLALDRAGGAVLPAPGSWTIDPQHSSIRARPCTWA